MDGDAEFVGTVYGELNVPQKNRSRRYWNTVREIGKELSGISI